MIRPGETVDNEFHTLVGRKLVTNFKPGKFYSEVMGKPYESPTPIDVSLRPKRGEEAIVDTVILSENAQHLKFAKVKTRSVRIPEIGDKFASRHGQKGTIGMIFNQ